MCNILELFDKAESVNSLNIPSDLTESSLEAALDQIGCQSDEFKLYVSTTDYFEAVRSTSLFLILGGSKKTANDVIVLCPSMDRYGSILTYKHKLVYSKGA